MQKTKPKLVFFDFDGVVLDSAQIKTKAFPEVFKDYPIHLDAIRTYHLDNQGISRFEKFEWIYKTLLNKDLSESKKIELGEEFSKIVLDKVMNCEFIPGAEDLLKYLKQKQIISIVASGTPYQELQTIVEKRNLSSYFVEVWGSPKHKKEIVIDILDKYGLQPSEALFLGDATTDYEAAKACNVPFQAVFSEEMDEFWKQNKVSTINNLSQVIEQYF